ncbi:hypothetical protein [Demequina aurantiaca]|uniref:hypothetical protein n=1 Tax=Demequina aurantiaca TaxID=676200 RepID=UPI003D337431
MMVEFNQRIEVDDAVSVEHEPAPPRRSMTESVWVEDPIGYLNALKAETQQVRAAFDELELSFTVASPRGWFEALVSRGIVSKVSFDAEALGYTRPPEIGTELVGLLKAVEARYTIGDEEFAKRFPLTFSAREHRSR